MGRSPSPVHKRREKERSERKKRRERRSRERERERERDRQTGTSLSHSHRNARRRSRERERHRSRSGDRQLRRRSRSKSTHSRDCTYPSSSAHSRAERPKITEADLEGKSAEEIDMLKTMGFCSFDTTKHKKVDGNDVGEVHVILKRKYRQYMNRKGGFNRPLDFVA